MLDFLFRAGASVKHECGAAMRMEVAGDGLEESITYTCEWNGTWTPHPGNPPPKCKCEIKIRLWGSSSANSKLVSRNSSRQTSATADSSGNLTFFS